jgi:hypothetical protein
MPTRNDLAAFQPRRRDGFSDDGLSYSVADDYSKQMGQALANYEARTAHPRFIPGARVENPDAPDILKQELFDPITTAFTGGGRQALQPKTFHVGNELLQQDPFSGAVKSVYASQKPKPTLDKGDEMALGNAYKTITAIHGKPSYAISPEDTQALADANSTVKRLYSD